MNPSKDKGTAWERACADWLAEHGWPDCDRTVQRGNKDRGEPGQRRLRANIRIGGTRSYGGTLLG